MPRKRHTGILLDDDQPWIVPGGRSKSELASLVCKFFCRGMSVNDICDKLENDYQVKLNREHPYKLITWAAKRGRLRYHAPAEVKLRKRILRSYPSVQNARVVHTASSDDVARYAARMLLRLVRSHRREHPDSQEFHIGFAGGNAIRKTARYFAELLLSPWPDLPQRIVLHAMVAGYNVDDPITDPNAFFTFFGPEHPLQVDVSFVRLFAPGMVSREEMDRLRGFREVRRGFDRANEIDVVVTSAGHWKNGDSALYQMFARESTASLEQLLAAGCIGDLLWSPLGPDGPIEIETEMRPITLMQLSQLPAFIDKGKHVLLVAAPCGKCHGPKSDVLAAILNQRPPRALITHLVTDSRSAGGLFPGDGAPGL